MSSNEYGVVVAVGADGVRDGALDLAAAEAARLGTGVEVTHVTHALVVAAPEDLERIESVDRVMSKVGREVLTDAAERLRERMPDPRAISVQLRSGPVARTLVERSVEADLVVLERRAVGTVERLLTMSVSSRVAAHAEAPVVVVPQGWSPSGSAALPVTAGVDDVAEALGQVQTAAAYAVAVHRPLRVLHALWLAEPYQDLTVVEGGRTRWLERTEAELDEVLAKLDERDGLEVASDVRWAPPTDALVTASRTSSLLVLSRRRPARLGVGRLGPVTRAVLEHAQGPVLVVDRT